MIHPYTRGAQRAKMNGRDLDLRQYRDEFRLRDWPEERRPEVTSLDELDRVETFAGLDLGQMSDPCALAVVRRHRYDARMAGPHWPYLEVCRLHVWPTGPNGAAYRDVINAALMLRPDVLCYDYGGVGAGLVDTFRIQAQAVQEKFPHSSPTRLVPVRTVGASNAIRILASPETRYLTIPKVDIVTGLNVVAQQRVAAGCKHCNAIKVGEKATIRLGNHAGAECEVLEQREGGYVVAVQGVGKRLCGAIDLYRSRPSQSCPSCSYLRFCLPDERIGRRLLTELASFREKMSGGGNKTYEHRSKNSHGDLVIAMGLAVLMTNRSRRELVMR